MRRALEALPPADTTRPVSLNSRRRRNAARVYVEEERKYMGLDDYPNPIQTERVIVRVAADQQRVQ